MPGEHERSEQLQHIPDDEIGHQPDYGQIDEGHLPAPLMTRHPESANPLHVEEECDDSDGNSDIRADLGHGPQPQGGNHEGQNHVAEGTAQPGEDHGKTEETLRRLLAGRPVGRRCHRHPEKTFHGGVAPALGRMPYVACLPGLGRLDALHGEKSRPLTRVRKTHLLDVMKERLVALA